MDPSLTVEHIERITQLVLDICGGEAGPLDDQTLALYTTASFGTRSAMADYTCWGTGGTRPFLSVARTAGTDGTVLWDDGGCTTASGSAIIHRLASREGNTAGDYATIEPSESLDCSPDTE